MIRLPDNTETENKMSVFHYLHSHARMTHSQILRFLTNFVPIIHSNPFITRNNYYSPIYIMFSFKFCSSWQAYHKFPKTINNENSSGRSTISIFSILRYRRRHLKFRPTSCTQIGCFTKLSPSNSILK